MKSIVEGEYEQKIPQLQTSDQPTAPQGRHRTQTVAKQLAAQLFKIFYLFSVAEYADLSLPENRFSSVATHLFFIFSESVLNTVKQHAFHERINITQVYRS